MKNISKHITYLESTFSAKALSSKVDNIPSEEHLVRMIYVAEQCFEPLRVWYNKPIKINSFYRSPVLNKLVKGSKTSGHVLGNSIDITAGSKKENEKLFNWLKENVKYDQLINEYDFTWIHISTKIRGNRNMCFKIV